MEKEKEKEFTSGKMEINLKVILKITNSVIMENSLIKTVKDMKDNYIKEKEKEKEFIISLMEIDMKVTSKMTKEMEKVFIIGMMVIEL